ncbi:MAG: ATP-dependent RecD-like DNA helicase [Desulfamplus sp.]|nr:ATP-dependent RecD-like DNA helicase [Desulfamplus sp.]
MTTLKGTLQRITFKSEDNHYTIARLKIHEIKEPVTIVGHLAGVAEGEMLSLTGKWVSHAKYGEQFKVERFEVTLPATLGGIKKYLSSGMIKGIGESIAKKIVGHFKEQSLDIIENEPHRLCEIDGIGKAKMTTISRAWDQHHSVRKVMQFLQEHGIGISHASAIINFYGRDALKVLQARPYQLSRDIPEAGFEVADAIALKTGTALGDPERIKASLIYLLLKNETDGHVFCEKNDLLQRCVRLTGADLQIIEPALINLHHSKEIVLENDINGLGKNTKGLGNNINGLGNHTNGLGNDINHFKNGIKTLQNPIPICSVYTRKMHRAETGIALKIKAMLSISVPDYGIDDDIIAMEILNRLALKLSDEQSDIVRQILLHRVTVITGGPGTGKTTLVRAVCAVLGKLHKKVILAAPTGRAARRLSEVTGRKASTLHKMLLYDPDAEFFGKNQDNPLDADAVIVDEASMIDTLLMYHLMLAVPMNGMLVLVGDIFQLPSIGPGNVLSDIINSGVVKTFSLTKIFRQAEQSPIILNAHCIRNGQMPVLEKQDREAALSEFYFIENNEPERVVRTITELCSCRIKNAFSHIDEIQVLTPMHKGEAGTINLNQHLQKVLNNRPGGIESMGILFKTGDKVMHLKNNYQKEVFNGDIGVVDEIIKSENRLVVDYDGRLVDYDIMELDELTLAYAVSVHKSQGSEYSAVVIALTTMHYPLLQRNLLYTAMTRGKKLVILVGSRRAVEIALNNNRTDFRLSGLCQKIRGGSLC